MPEELKYRRTQYLVDREYQLRFVSRLFVVVLAIAIVSSLVATGMLWLNMYQPEIERQVHVVSALIGVSIVLLVELLISIPIVYFLGIRQSHRVVGPLHRIEKALEAIGAGDFSQRITLRKGDALEDLAGAINRMAERLQQRR